MIATPYPVSGRICVLVWAVLGAAVALSPGCNKADRYCGNRVVEADLGEQCDDANDNPSDGCDRCRIRAVQTTRVITNWTINGESIFGGGTFDTCRDVNAAFVHVQMSGPGGYFDEQENSCGGYQATFTESELMPLAPGIYTVTADILDDNRAPLATQQATQLAVVDGIDNTLVVDFPLTDFAAFSTFRGDLGFRTFWEIDAGTCTDASPVVAQRVVSVELLGQPLSGYPTTEACHTDTEWVTNLVPGDYQVRVEGWNAQSQLTHCGLFDVRVGIGSGQAYRLVVDTTPDATSCP